MRLARTGSGCADDIASSQTNLMARTAFDSWTANTRNTKTMGACKGGFPQPPNESFPVIKALKCIKIRL